MIKRPSIRSSVKIGKLGTFAAGICLAGVFTSSLPTASAVSVKQFSRPQMLAHSDLVFVGTVQSSSCRWTNDNRVMITTAHTVKIDRIVSNDLNDKDVGQTIELQFAGGTVDGEAVKVPGVPELNVGDSAVFFVQGDSLQSISPVVGVYQGLYSVTKNQQGQSVVTPFGESASGAAAKSTASSQNLEDFLAEIEQELPAARQNASLRQTAQSVAPRSAAPLARFVPQDPNPTFHVRSSEIAPRAAENEVALPAPGDAKDATSSGTIEAPHDSFPQLSAALTRFRYLWGPPAAMRTFNVPPSYGSWGTAVEHSLANWNRYADIHRIYSEPENSFGHQGRNDIVMETGAYLTSIYGITIGSDLLGYAVLYNSNGDLAQNNHVIYESDMLLNTDTNWTTDYNAAYEGGGSTYYIESTAIHELGHCFGREHSFTENPNAWWHSVMDYPPPGKLDTLFYAPFCDDAQGIREAYPAQAQTISDSGYYMFYTENGNQLWATHPSTASTGDVIPIQNHVVENLGTDNQNPVLDWYLVANYPDFVNPYYHCGSSSIGTLNTFSTWKGTTNITIPSDVPAGSYYIACVGAADGYSGNNVSWSDGQITIAATSDLTFSATNAIMTLKGTKGTIAGNLDITNQGGKTTDQCELGVYLYGSPTDAILLRTFIIPSLAPGSTVTIEPGIEYKGKKYKPKNIKYKFHKGFADGKSILFCIDDKNIIDESNEFNNTWQHAIIPYTKYKK